MRKVGCSKTGLLLWAIVGCFLVLSQVAKGDFTFGTPTKVPNINSSSWDHEPSISPDGLTLYFSSNRSTTYGSLDLWVTTRSTTNDPWGTPVNLGSSVNTSACETDPAISADTLSLFFCDEVWGIPAPHRPGGYGASDLWVSKRATKDDRWGEPVNLGPTVNSSYGDGTPCISSDGLSLFFASERPGGSGSADLWVTRRPTLPDPWGPPVNLGPIVNTVHTEGDPSISTDGLTLFFTSSRPGGSGSFDLWMTRRKTKDDNWATPLNLGPTLNTSARDWAPEISWDGSVLYFASDRPYVYGDWELWDVSISPILDFNGDRKVDFKDFSKLAQYWGQNGPSCDIAPPPLGDSIVDIHDVAVLAENWLTELGLIAHWKLDETEGFIAHDSAGDHDGFLMTENPLWRPLDGQVDGALELDGIDDYVSTQFVLNPAQGSFSVFAWVKSSSAGRVILSQQAGADWLHTVPPIGWLMTNLGRGGPLLSQTVITDGQWHRIGLTWDGTNRTLYVDDIEAAKDTDTGLQSADRGLYFGAGNNLEPVTFFSGLIDDLRIYDRAVTP